jgi:hypothetical protein
VVVLVMLVRIDKRPGATPAAFPLQSLLEQPLFCGFMFFAASSREHFEGYLYMCFLGQTEQSEMKMDSIGGPRTKQGQVAQPGLVVVPPGLFWASWPSSLTSCSPDAFF